MSLSNRICNPTSRSWWNQIDLQRKISWNTRDTNHRRFRPKRAAFRAFSQQVGKETPKANRSDRSGTLAAWAFALHIVAHRFELHIYIYIYYYCYYYYCYYYYCLFILFFIIVHLHFFRKFYMLRRGTDLYCFRRWNSGLPTLR